MTPAARVQTAIELLEPILDGAPAERVLTQWARKSRFAGSKDRAAIRDHVYDVLRRKKSAAYSGGGESPRALMIGLLRLQGIDPEEIFTGISYAPDQLSESEKSHSEIGETIDLPNWITADLKASLGDEFDEIEQHLKNRAPVVVRANLRRATREAAKAKLIAEGIKTTEHPASKTALEVQEGARKIKNSAAFRFGEIELQDVASQAAIEMLSKAATDAGLGRVLDYCAGGGGKLLAMAGKFEGRYFAHDANPSRLRDLPERSKRAGVKAKILATADLSANAAFDLIFCDVPCSGSGTWRRDPDAKWKLDRTSLNKTLLIQRNILSDASSLVRSKGYLAYATCSLLDAENKDQISGFLADNPDWQCLYQKSWTPLDGCDGFFTALLQKP